VDAHSAHPARGIHAAAIYQDTNGGHKTHMKTYEYAIHQYTGRQYGWEEVTREESFIEAKKRAQEYRENQPEYPIRIVIVQAGTKRVVNPLALD
jgi:hypothetical protein